MVSGARCAIRMRSSKETDTTKALISLRRDLENRPCHVFGIRTHCSPNFCTVQQQQQQDLIGGRSIDGAAEENCTDNEEDHAQDRAAGTVMVKRIMMMTVILGVGYSTYEIRIITYYPIHVISIATYLSC